MSGTRSIATPPISRTQRALDVLNAFPEPDIPKRPGLRWQKTPNLVRTPALGSLGSSAETFGDPHLGEHHLPLSDRLQSRCEATRRLHELAVMQRMEAMQRWSAEQSVVAHVSAYPAAQPPSSPPLLCKPQRCSPRRTRTPSCQTGALTARPFAGCSLAGIAAMRSSGSGIRAARCET